MNSPCPLLCSVLVSLTASAFAAPGQPAEIQPNIVVILADDLGYADASCYGGKIATPHIDRLAAEGMRFTDAHSTSSVCTPTRYGLLTGRYNWRTKLQRGVLGGLSPRLIEPGRTTLASLLQGEGYHTACIGKWHLGMDWTVKPGADVAELTIESREQVFNVDFTQPIAKGPNSVGFDYYYGISASLDMVPYTFIENDRVASLPTEDRDFLMMHDRTPQRRTRKGPAAPAFDAAEVLPVIAGKSVEYIGQRAAAAREGQPFFLYVPLASPHTPILPTPEWRGKSGLNPYADFVMQSDWAVGEILAALDQHKLTDQTLVVFTSDNGCSPEAKLDELAAQGHHPCGRLRGHKADLFEGGLRIPFLARWPGQIPAGTTSDQLICQVDLLATVAQIVGCSLPTNAGEDSLSFLPTLRNGAVSARDHLISHSINGSFAIRRGPWKLLLCPDSGGWSQPQPGSKQAAGLPPLQLFNLDDDLAERDNLAASHPEKVRELTALLEQLVAAGRSTAGPPQPNHGPINIRANISANQTRRPNILFILTDDQRWDAIGLGGSKHLATPHIDRLGKEGVYFRNSFCTTALCSPSRASILSGLYAHAHGVVDKFTEYPENLQSFPLVLQSVGYDTAYVGKWHMGEGNDAPRPGFHWFVTHQGQGKYFDTEFNINGRERKIVEGYYTTVVTDMAEEWLARERAQRPGA